MLVKDFLGLFFLQDFYYAHTMYFLTPLLLSGALAAAQDVNESASTSKSVIDTLKTSTAPAGSIKTVFTTVTRTLYPVTTHLIPSYPPPTTEISSHFAMPPSVTSSGPAFIYESTDLGAGPIYDDTSLAPHNVHTTGFAPWHPYSSLSGQREFAFVASSTTILFEGHYTPKTSSTKSYCEHRSTGTTPATLLAATTSPYPRPTRSNLGYAPSPSSASYTASSQPYASSTRSSVGYASTPGQSTVSDETMGILPIHTVIASDETVDIMPIPTPTDNNFDIMSLPDEEESVGILPLPNAEETMDVMPLPTRNPVQALPITSASPASSKPPNLQTARSPDLNGPQQG